MARLRQAARKHQKPSMFIWEFVKKIPSELLRLGILVFVGYNKNSVGKYESLEGKLQTAFFLCQIISEDL